MKLNSTVFLILVFLSVLLGCNKQKDDITTLGNYNSVVTDNIDNWEKIKNTEINNRPCKDMDLRFLNNPFELIDENISIHIDNNVLIYKGKYSGLIDVCIPDNLMQKYLHPSLIIYKDNKTYNFLGKSHIEILPDDKYLNIVFMPERGVVGGCLMFANRVELQ
jgi:hypothetical protein